MIISDECSLGLSKDCDWAQPFLGSSIHSYLAIYDCDYKHPKFTFTMTSSTILFNIFFHRNKYIFDDVRKRIVFVFSRPNQENNFLPHLPFFCTSFTKLDEAKIMPLNIFAIEGTCCMSNFQRTKIFWV